MASNGEIEIRKSGCEGSGRKMQRVLRESEGDEWGSSEGASAKAQQRCQGSGVV